MNEIEVLEMLFEPTDEQIQVRRLVRNMYNEGDCLVAQWVVSIPSFSLQKWNEWQNLEGFQAWWLELLPEQGGLTVTDLKTLEFEVGRSLLQLLKDDDPKAVTAVLSLINSSTTTQEIADNGVEDWYASSSKGNGWKIEDK